MKASAHVTSTVQLALPDMEPSDGFVFDCGMNLFYESIKFASSRTTPHFVLPALPSAANSPERLHGRDFEAGLQTSVGRRPPASTALHSARSSVSRRPGSHFLAITHAIFSFVFSG
jgi:hypothetical protein